MENVKKLDVILLSGRAKEKFRLEMNKDKDFSKWLTSTLPEIQDCDGLNQNSVWHTDDVLTHMLKSVDSLTNKFNDLEANRKRLLSYTMFLHDIGKPEAKTDQMKDGKVISSFKGHSETSEKIARRVLPEFDFSEKEIEVMSALILNHDCLMNEFKGQDLNKKLKYRQETVQGTIDYFSRLGDGHELACDLFMVIYADNMAQNPKLTQNIANAALEAHDKISQMEKQNDEYR